MPRRPTAARSSLSSAGVIVVGVAFSSASASLDDAVDADVARALASLPRALARARAFRENRTVFARDGARCALVKPGIFELEAHAMTTAQRELAPRFSRMTGRGTPMRDALNAALRRGDDGTPRRGRALNYR